MKAVALIVAGAVSGLIAGCGGGSSESPGPEAKSAARVRATRRAYDGAPPVIPHKSFGAACTSCHNRRGVAVPGVGFAPPSPHARTRGLSNRARCRQCHVFRATTELFKPTRFFGMRQDLRKGRRHHPLAPPVMPHRVFMRENCAACHTGAAAREEIRTSHPERLRCPQCHLQQVERSRFSRK